MRILSAALLLCLLTGCATQVWYQPGKTPAEARRDLATAKAEAARLDNPLAMVNGWFWLANDGNKKDFIQNTMVSKGYEPTPIKQVPDGNQYPHK